LNRIWNHVAQPKPNGHFAGLEDSGKYIVGGKGNIRCRHVCGCGWNKRSAIKCGRKKKTWNGWLWLSSGGRILGLHLGGWMQVDMYAKYFEFLFAW